MPPFWELEDLIAAGLEHEAALQVMAARRAALTLVDATRPHSACADLPAAHRFKLIF